mgnify:CR=1 FL=1
MVDHMPNFGTIGFARNVILKNLGWCRLEQRTAPPQILNEVKGDKL